MQNRTRSTLMRTPLVNINRSAAEVRVRAGACVLRKVRRAIHCVRQPTQPEQTIRTLGFVGRSPQKPISKMLVSTTCMPEITLV